MNLRNTTDSLTHAVKQEACRLGFDVCRIVPVGPAPHADFFERWLKLGRAGEMGYLERNREKRRHPALLADTDSLSFRSLLVLAVNHHQFDLPSQVRDDPARGLIAAYAWGDDYHGILRPLLHKLDAFIRRRSGRTTLGKCLVDSGPILERDWAQRAGVGFTGKNCCTIHPGGGSWLLLATIWVPEALDYDPPPRAVHAPTLSAEEVAVGLPPGQKYGSWQIPAPSPDLHLSSRPATPSRTATCGRCTRCLDACPTRAFVGPYHLDPLRCISYWTIEARSPIPRHLRPLFGNRIFGCDICQEVCPWNRRLPARTPRLPGLRALEERMAPPLLEGFRPDTPYWLQEKAFNTHFRRSPVKRARRQGMLRNVCVALGNWADPLAVPALTAALRDAESLARGHAAWALGQILLRHRDERATRALEMALAGEADAWVGEEMRRALGDGAA